MKNIVVTPTIHQEYEAQVKALKEKKKKSAQAEAGIGGFSLQMGFQFKGLGFDQAQTAPNILFCRKRLNLHLSCI